MALTSGGRVMSAGSNSHGQCETGDWADVVAVAAGSLHTLAVRGDGSVLAAGCDGDGQCRVEGWRLSC